jgi:hypothetical protein
VTQSWPISSRYPHGLRYPDSRTCRSAPSVSLGVPPEAHIAVSRLQAGSPSHSGSISQGAQNGSPRPLPEEHLRPIQSGSQEPAAQGGPPPSVASHRLPWLSIFHTGSSRRSLRGNRSSASTLAMTASIESTAPSGLPGIAPWTSFEPYSETRSCSVAALGDVLEVARQHEALPHQGDA